jgi:hypothetical protein
VISERIAMRNEKIPVTNWDTIDAADTLDDPEKQRVATIFTESSWDIVVWIPEWLLEDKDDIATVESAAQLAVGRIEDYSEKAWKFEQRHGDLTTEEFLPKSSVVVFSRVRGVEEIETPQQGLDAFAGD